MTRLPLPRSASRLDEEQAGDRRAPELGLASLTLMLRRQRVLIGLCILGAVILGGVYTMTATRVYEATSLLRFELERVNLPQLVQQLSTENRISTEIEVLRGRAVAEAVVDSLAWRTRLRTPRRVAMSDLFTLIRVAPGTDTMTVRLRASDGAFRVQAPLAAEQPPVRIGDTVRVGGLMFALAPAAERQSDLRLEVVSVDDAVRSFRRSLVVSRPARDADLIAIRVRTGDPKRAAAAANLLAVAVIGNRQDVHRTRTESTVSYLSQQLDTLSRRLRLAEDALRAYREQARVLEPGHEARTQVVRLSQIQADRGALDAERQALATLLAEADHDSVEGPEGDQAPSRRFIAFPTLFKNPATSQLLGALAQVENERASLLNRRTPADPDVQMLTARIRELDGQLQGIARTYLQGLTNQVASLDQVARRFGADLDQMPEKDVRSARLEREVRVNQDLYTMVKTRLKEAEITQAIEDSTVRLVDRAVVPVRPVRPLTTVNLALSLILGAALGLTLAVRRELTDQSVRSRADALTASGLPVLGAIPRAADRGARWGLPRPRRRLRARSGPLAQLNGDRSDGNLLVAAPTAGLNREGDRIAALLVTGDSATAAYAEAFNQLHVNLVLGHLDRPLKVLVFTSPLPGEGKTLSATNFALTIARRGLRVLLIDADFRCGKIDAVFRCDRSPGLAEMLAGTARFDEAARSIPVGEAGSLVFLPAGAPAAGSGYVLTLERVRAMLDAVAPEFDLVVIDTPPVNILADAALLGAAAHGVVLVVRARRTQIDAVRYAVDQLAIAGAPVVGTVLNDIDLSRSTYDDGSYRYLAEAERYHAERH